MTTRYIHNKKGKQSETKRADRKRERHTLQGKEGKMKRVRER